MLLRGVSQKSKRDWSEVNKILGNPNIINQLQRQKKI